MCLLVHEYPITVKIIQMAEEAAIEQQATKVKKIHLMVGDYCGYVGSSINLYFPIIAENTMCSEAELVIERIKPKLRCGSCNRLFEREAFSFVCPFCQGEGSPTDIGKEFYIMSIEVEQ